MEEKFLFALESNRQKAEQLGIRIRPVKDMKQAHQILSDHNYHGKKRKNTVDAVAASLILEGYLNSLPR